MRIDTPDQGSAQILSYPDHQATERSPAGGRRKARLSRQSGFSAVAFSFLTVSAFSTAPSALYGLYAQRDHLSSLTVTIVYAVYAGGIVVSLVLAGHVSDWYGRRVVLLPALGIAIVAAIVFLVWRSLPGLLVARVLTGFALGITVATATAHCGLGRTRWHRDNSGRDCGHGRQHRRTRPRCIDRRPACPL